MPLERHRQPVLGRPDGERKPRKFFGEFRVAGKHMGEVREIALSGADAAADFKGFFQGVV